MEFISTLIIDNHNWYCLLGVHIKKIDLSTNPFSARETLLDRAKNYGIDIVVDTLEDVWVSNHY